LEEIPFNAKRGHFYFGEKGTFLNWLDTLIRGLDFPAFVW
jgi:hypothetical protein